MAAVLGYAGHAFPWWIQGQWQMAHGWQELIRVRLPFGIPWAAACDAPSRGGGDREPRRALWLLSLPTRNFLYCSLMLASRIFDATDQKRFAELTGDYNPMHMDPMAARRTQAGVPIVHGIHTLLWLLDAIAAEYPELAGIKSLNVRFSKMIYLGDRVDAHITRHTGEKIRARAYVDDVEVVRISATLGTASPAAKSSIDALAESIPHQTSPLDLAWKDLGARSGRVSFGARAIALERAFPNVSRLLGARRVAALGCTSYLVGMIVPGLHSIYGGLALDLTADNDPADELAFAVTSVDERFRGVQLAIVGGGLWGSLDTFSRVPPIVQPSIDALAPLVSRDEFKEVVALIVGGSRGLGEITAKLIAAGGGRVIATYVTGKLEAECLAGQINSWGGRCDILAYDARKDAVRQLQGLGQPPTQLYYFATPPIFRRPSNTLIRARLDEFNEFYVYGFLRTVEAGLRLRPSGIAVFYPSSVAVQDRPAGMTEYAMSKAAGEVLCADIAKYRPGVNMIAQRLPRVITDQTASLFELETADGPDVMLPIIRRMREPHPESATEEIDRGHGI